MELEPWLHFGHVAGVAIWIGGGSALALIATRIRATDDLKVLQTFARTLSFVGLSLFTPAIVVVLLTGIGMVLGSSGDFTTPWIALGITALVAAFLIGALFLSRSAIRFGRLANEGDLSGARAALGNWLSGYIIVLVILFLALWDMVFKPGT